ncbi:MAG: cobalamin biosynthesis protein CobD [Salinarimonas sp.]|nr:cobalamin biosynthesis protein CobD [Salinarimonas sp.]
MLLALIIDAAIGWPGRLYARIGHPVTWIGAAISWCDARFNREGDPPAGRARAGMLTALAVILVAMLPALTVAILLPAGWMGIVMTGLIAWPLIATRSMHDHVAAVAAPLTAGDLDGARGAVAMIVGRDPTLLDAPGVTRAAIESLAENTSDGIVAPIFWGVLLGLPGIVTYKAINTLDSMIGHRNARYTDFGRFAAKLDDVVNWVPARLTGLLFALISRRPTTALAVMRRDARHHRSPNAGWPEAAMAGALGVRLSGPRSYGSGIRQEPWLNGEAPDPRADDLRAGLALYRRAMIALAALLAGITVLLALP